MICGAGDVRIETVPDAGLVKTTDAVFRATHAAICGGDLSPHATMKPSDSDQSVGHWALGTVEAVGSDVSTVKPGDPVIMPYAWSDGTCEFCHHGPQTFCLHVGVIGTSVCAA